MADAPLWLQVLGPVATIGASIAASVIAYRFGQAQVRINDAQREIAASQRDIAKRRVQMDLHDKRYEILRAARELMGEALRSPSDKMKMQELRRTFHRLRSSSRIILPRSRMKSTQLAFTPASSARRTTRQLKLSIERARHRSMSDVSSINGRPHFPRS